MKDTVLKYGRRALITGGTSGIGLAIAEQLARNGHDLILVARNQDKLEQTAEKLSIAYGIQVQTEAVDLADPESSLALYNTYKEQEVGLAILAAGLETSGNITATPVADLDQVVAVNISAPMKLARLFGADMAKRGKGGIMLFSSLFAYQAVPIVANYSATKAYILSFGEALHLEMRPHNVDVLVVSPGLTDTPMPAQMPINFNKLPITKHAPRQVADIALNALGRKASVVPGLLNKVFAFENRFIPRLWPSRLFGFLIKRALDKDQRDDLLGQSAE